MIVEATRAGVSENQNVSLRLNERLALRYRMDEYSPFLIPSSRPTPTIA